MILNVHIFDDFIVDIRLGLRFIVVVL